jgi:hypothetical protein
LQAGSTSWRYRGSHLIKKCRNLQLSHCSDDSQKLAGDVKKPSFNSFLWFRSSDSAYFS